MNAFNFEILFALNVKNLITIDDVFLYLSQLRAKNQLKCTIYIGKLNRKSLFKFSIEISDPFLYIRSNFVKQTEKKANLIIPVNWNAHKRPWLHYQILKSCSEYIIVFS